MIKGINRISFIFMLTFLFLLSSCNSKVVYTNSQTMSEETWKLMDITAFKVPITDTFNSNNVFFTDTLQYNLADEKGKWYGKGFGDIHELNLPYKSNVYFPLKGTYEFKIQHGMRVENLKGVYDFGLRIEKIRK